MATAAAWDGMGLRCSDAAAARKRAGQGAGRGAGRGSPVDRLELSRHALWVRGGQALVLHSTRG